MDKRRKSKLKNKIGDLVRTAGLEETLSKRDTTNWSFKFYELTKILTDTIPNYRFDNVPENYKEAFLKKDSFTIEKKNFSVMNKLNLTKHPNVYFYRIFNCIQFKK